MAVKYASDHIFHNNICQAFFACSEWSPGAFCKNHDAEMLHPECRSMWCFNPGKIPPNIKEEEKDKIMSVYMQKADKIIKLPKCAC